MTRIAITGAGVVSALGRDRRAVFDALLEGKSGVGDLPRLGCRGACVPGFDVREAGQAKNTKYLSRASALAVTAARLALDESGCAGGDDLACFVGIGMTASELDDVTRLVEVSRDERGEISPRLLGEHGLRVTNPLISFKLLSNMPLCHVALATKARGPNGAQHSLGGETLATLAEACQEILEGRARAALWGGVDAQLEHVGMKQLSRRGLLSSGRVLGEGSAFLVLEREEDARARGARVLGILESVALAASSAIDLSEVAPEPIEDAVSRCRGTRSLGAVISSAAGDPRGDAALARALGATAPVVSFRAALGDTLAAGPAIDLVLALEALERRTLPATPPLNGDPILVVAAGLSATVGAAVLGAAS